MGQTSERALPVVVFNAVGAMPTNRAPLGNRILKAASMRGALLIGVECDDLEPAAVLDPDVWWWRHRQADVKDGGFLAGLRKRTHASETQALLGAPSSPVNAERYFLKAKIRVDDSWSFTAAAMHVPLWKGGGREAATTMVIRSQTIDADLLAGDFNLGIDAVKRRYPNRTVRGREVMMFAARQSLHIGRAVGFDLLEGTGSDDHPGVRVTVRPR